ncbi:alpha- and gamma-adaptin-binding protein p34-like [Ornithodoros turicata]|uniref:alpha- and gamma-adaptin-binding protein p34-like n=1 Tax=Ornithodoros turicata TaxID=34597 RepID=UPI003139E88E
MGDSEDSQYGCLIVSCSELSPPEPLVREILGAHQKLDEAEMQNGEKSCTWNLNTKYYTAQVPVHWRNERYQPEDEPLLCHIHGLVLFCNTDQIEVSLERATEWLSHCNEAQVTLLVIRTSHHCAEEEEEEEEEPPELQTWCLKHQCELVCWHDDAGIQRIREALSAHPWPQLQKHAAESADVAEGEDDGLPASFEELFAHFRELKEKAEGMTGEERRDFAEKVAVQFWKACGGDDDEISGLVGDG